MKTYAEYKSHPSVAGLTGKAKSAAIEALQYADAVAEDAANKAARKAACEAMATHYDAARAQLANAAGGFGKELDRKARKLAIKLSGVQLPEWATIAWATPDGWGTGPLGYRAQSAKTMQP